jgi:3-oxoacyl-(acyl-carrier-protein) synthase
MVTGGSEAAVTIAGMGGFNAMHALSTRNDTQKTASRPMDKDRDVLFREGAVCFRRIRACLLVEPKYIVK